MASNAKTADGGIDVSFDNPPEYAMTVIPLPPQSGATNMVFFAFVPAVAYEVVSLSAFPRVISSGTMKTDITVDGTSILSTKATATVANTPVAPVFSSTRLPAGSVVVVQTTSDSSSVTTATGHLVIRPLLGAERKNP